MNTTWKYRFYYFIFGLIFSSTISYILLHWMNIVPYPNYDSQSEFLKILNEIVLPWLPWIIFIVLLIFRFRLGKQIKVGSYFLGAIFPLVTMVMIMLLSVPTENYIHQKTFDAKRWNSKILTNTNSQWPVKLCMVDDLITSSKLNGLSKQNVIDILGTPEPKGFPSGVKEDYIYYYLGPERNFMSIDSEWLYITFDKNGIVQHYWIQTD